MIKIFITLFYFKYHRFDDFLVVAGVWIILIKASKSVKNSLKRAFYDHKCVQSHLKTIQIGAKAQETAQESHKNIQEYNAEVKQGRRLKSTLMAFFKGCGLEVWGKHFIQIIVQFHLWTAKVGYFSPPTIKYVMRKHNYIALMLFCFFNCNGSYGIG
jgi:hypothetical protein